MNNKNNMNEWMEKIPNQLQTAGYRGASRFQKGNIFLPIGGRFLQNLVESENGQTLGVFRHYRKKKEKKKSTADEEMTGFSRVKSKSALIIAALI